MRTVQQSFDYVVDKIVQQGGQCLGEKSCAYGNVDGKHCAIGWLLDHDNMEVMHYGAGLRSLVDDYPEAVPQIVKDNFQFFSRLQDFHDVDPAVIRLKISVELEKDYGIDISNPNVQLWIDMAIGGGVR
jgi:hypothetical protein